MQVDLGEASSIYAIVLWHDHRYIQVMHDVIVQVSDDPEFKNGVTTLFNNDVDNSSGLGVGAGLAASVRRSMCTAPRLSQISGSPGLIHSHHVPTLCAIFPPGSPL